ncbi:MAG: nitroreductase family protein [Thermotogota bacterium]
MRELLKKIKTLTLKLWHAIDNKLIFVAYKNSIFASLYYMFWSKSFNKEHYAVLSGRVKYIKDTKLITQDSVLLRRNIHKLEKGIIMRPRRSVFATTYISETINAYESSLKNIENQKIKYSNSLIWAHDVLKEYFSIIDGNNSVVNKARQQFTNLPSLESEGTSKPYKRNLTDSLSMHYNDLLSLSLRRRSVRWYVNRTVPRKVIDKAIKIAGLSPSACNRQPFKFLIYDDPELINKIAKIPMGTKGFYHNLPGIIVVVGDLSAYFNERDRHVIYIDASLAAMSLLYALEVQNVSSCIINWPDISRLETKLRKTLSLSSSEKAIMFISYGYPDRDGMVPYSQKKDIDTLRIYNK